MKRLVSQIVDCLHAVYAGWGIIRYRSIYRKLVVIGVTGTDGKSSTVILTSRLLKKSHLKVAHYSSISICDGDHEIINVNKMTTPGKAYLHKFLAKAARNGVTHVVLEITSEGIKQWRHLGIKFNFLVYTNITPEHIERHGSFENYKQTKLSLLKSLTSKNGKVIWNISDPELRKAESTFRLHSNLPVEVIEKANNLNPFIELNYQLAQATLRALNSSADLDDQEKTLPGRFELFNGNPSILIDYAHTPVALDMCLKAASQINSGKLIHVFGAAGGGRDTWKRPLIAKISEQYADIHILTEENSFDEPVENIIADIEKGFSHNAEVYTETVREEAIKKAISLSDEQDLIVCTAKGSEVIIAGKKNSKRAYNEREFVKKCLNLN